MRRNSGIACLGLGAGFAVAASLGVSARTLGSLGVLLILAGLFQLFESHKGWCAVRALGIRTPV